MTAMIHPVSCNKQRSCDLNHFTNLQGYHGIRAAPTWRFRASQPPDPRHHPFGAYFTTLAPDTLKLAKRLGIPKSKIEYLFSFADLGDLRRVDSDRGEWIFYSPTDYDVTRESLRQEYHGKAGER